MSPSVLIISFSLRPSIEKRDSILPLSGRGPGLLCRSLLTVRHGGPAVIILIRPLSAKLQRYDHTDAECKSSWEFAEMSSVRTSVSAPPPMGPAACKQMQNYSPLGSFQPSSPSSVPWHRRLNLIPRHALVSHQ